MSHQTRQPAAAPRHHHFKAISLFVVGLLLIGLQGCTQQSEAQEHPVQNGAPAAGDETILLLLADGPLTSEPAPATPPLDLAGSELVLNGAIVPEMTIQSGLFLQSLYADSATGHSFSVVRWPADVSLERHWHPVTERLWMIDGSIASKADGEVGPGMYWEAPAQVAMGPFTSTGAVFAFLGEGPFMTHYLDAGEEAPRAGMTFAVDPDTMQWQPLADVVGSTVEGSMKVLSVRTETDRGVYLVRLTEPAVVPAYAIYGANLEGYVLAGALRFADPYHGTHLLTPGFYFRIPAGFPSSLLTTSG